MELKRPPFPAWPAWVGIVCFALMVMLVLDQRPRPEQAMRVTIASGEPCPEGATCFYADPQLSDRCGGQGYWVAEADGGYCVANGDIISHNTFFSPSVPGPLVESGTGEVVLGVTPNGDAGFIRLDQGGHVILSQQSEDRIVRRLQQWLDRNEAGRQLPVFGAK